MLFRARETRVRSVTALSLSLLADRIFEARGYGGLHGGVGVARHLAESRHGAKSAGSRIYDSARSFGATIDETRAG